MVRSRAGSTSEDVVGGRDPDALAPERSGSLSRSHRDPRPFAERTGPGAAPSPDRDTYPRRCAEALEPPGPRLRRTGPSRLPSDPANGRRPRGFLTHLIAAGDDVFTRASAGSLIPRKKHFLFLESAGAAPIVPAERREIRDDASRRYPGMANAATGLRPRQLHSPAIR